MGQCEPLASISQGIKWAHKGACAILLSGQLELHHLLLTMSTSNFENLSKTEQILYHYAAMVKKDLDEYHADSRREQDWVDVFKDHLVHFIFAIYFYKVFSDLSGQNQYAFILTLIGATQMPAS